MKKRVSGWICLFACLFYVAEVSVLPCFADEPKVAQRTRAGGDAGEAVPQDSGDGSGAWAWVLGAGAALAAGVIGFLLAEDAGDEKDSAKASADEAAASAAAAEAAAAGGGVAAVEDAVTIFIRGTFTTSVAAPQGDGSGTFIPTITFSVSDLLTYPGGITTYTAGYDGTPGAGGKVEQDGSRTLFIWTDDDFYNGVATVVDDHTLRLANGYVLTGPSRAIQFK